MISKNLVMVRNVTFGGLLALGLSSFAITAADAKNDHSNSGSGNSGSATHGNSDDNNQGQNSGKSVSLLGALNAAHASKKAFAHASPNSRVGKIKAYYLANQTAVVAKSAFISTLPAGTTLTQFNTVLLAYNALLNNLTDSALQTSYTQSLTHAGLTDASFKIILASASYSTFQNDAQTAQMLLDAAANKTPVSAATKAALDALLVGKI